MKETTGIYITGIPGRIKADDRLEPRISQLKPDETSRRTAISTAKTLRWWRCDREHQEHQMNTMAFVTLEGMSGAIR
ncbi:MAG: hypothetical protein ACLSAP_03120 [Oscillospiraceae bacterium]